MTPSDMGGEECHEHVFVLVWFSRDPVCIGCGKRRSEVEHAEALARLARDRAFRRRPPTPKQLTAEIERRKGR